MSTPRNQSTDSSAPIKQLEAPEGFQVEKTGHGLKITFSEQPEIAVIIFRYFLFGGFIVSMGGFISITSDLPDPRVELSLILMALFVGVVLIYGGLIKLINRYRIEVSSSILSIRSVPLPTIRNKNVDNTQISQLVVKQGVFTTWDGGSTYQLRVLLKDGSTVRFISGGDEYVLKFLKQQIEQQLGIPSQAMDNENWLTDESEKAG
jgi:hypothetical protein